MQFEHVFKKPYQTIFEGIDVFDLMSFYIDYFWKIIIVNPF